MIDTKLEDGLAILSFNNAISALMSTRRRRSFSSRIMSDQMIQDDAFARLLTFPNVLIAGHQGFFTADAMAAIAAVTIENLSSFEETGQATYQLPTDRSEGWGAA